jgi:hypothetical protein
MMRYTLGIIMMLHGAAHIAGFLSAWRLMGDQPYNTRILRGRFDLGPVGFRIFGITWLLLAAAFIQVGFGALINAGWWVPAAYLVAALSFVLCITALPVTRVGMSINAFIVFALLAMPGRLI